MKTSSAKAKGRNLQNYVVGRLLFYFNTLSNDDITSRSMGAGGEDILLSKAARTQIPFSIECKSHARYAIYKDYEQAKANADGHIPLVVIKQNRSTPLVVLDLEDFLELLHEKEKPRSQES